MPGGDIGDEIGGAGAGMGSGLAAGAGDGGGALVADESPPGALIVVADVVALVSLPASPSDLGVKG